MMGASLPQAMSPDGEAIVTGAGDETLRFWNVFSKTRSTKVSGWVGVGAGAAPAHSSARLGASAPGTAPAASSPGSAVTSPGGPHIPPLLLHHWHPSQGAQGTAPPCVSGRWGQTVPAWAPPARSLGFCTAAQRPLLCAPQESVSVLNLFTRIR